MTVRSEKRDGVNRLPAWLAFVGGGLVLGEIVWQLGPHPGLWPPVPSVVSGFLYPTLVLIGGSLLWRGTSTTQAWVAGGLAALGVTQLVSSVAALVFNFQRLGFLYVDDTMGWPRVLAFLVGSALVLVAGVVAIIRVRRVSDAPPESDQAG